MEVTMSDSVVEIDKLTDEAKKQTKRFLMN